MYISITELERSLERLKTVHNFFGMSLLAFKKARIPVGNTQTVVFSQIAEDILTKYYKPSTGYQGYYSPFRTSNPKQRWLAPRYPSTALQRITTDTFAGALLHLKQSSEWGWTEHYLRELKEHLSDGKIPAFALAVWLFRDDEWPDNVTPADVRDRFLSAFAFSGQEARALFDNKVPSPPHAGWLSTEPISETELLAIIGRPPGSLPEEGAALRNLELHHIGPATVFRYQPAERLNIITGDNSLGKTFLLECVWWALTGEWLDHAAQPRSNIGKRSPKIVSAVTVAKRPILNTVSRYDWDRQTWERPTTRDVLPGFVVYARHDGSFALWDPARVYMRDDTASKAKAHVVLARHQVWDGLERRNPNTNRVQWLCNGLVRDWVLWQTAKDRYSKLYESLIGCMKELSPGPEEILEPGQPTRLPFDARDIPTIKMAYGDVPVIFASAGVQRIIAMAYVLVWAWHEHLANSELIRRDPQRRLVLIVDEVEAHLHPRWQRVIVPALMKVVSHLSSAVTPQIHLATHSPMIMASAETVFDEEIDDLHHLRQDGSEVILEELPFVKRGRSDWWLISSVFGLRQPRSLPAEHAIEEAKSLQRDAAPNSHGVREVHIRLLRVLAPDDEFWPRWRSFAIAHGAEG